MGTSTLGIDAYLNEAVHASFPASIKSDELAIVSIELSADKAGVDGSRAWVDQVALSLLSL